MFKDIDVKFDYTPFLGDDEIDQMPGETDDAHEVRLAFLREQRSQTMTPEEKAQVAELMSLL
jgi:hypothetical protein